MAFRSSFADLLLKEGMIIVSDPAGSVRKKSRVEEIGVQRYLHVGSTLACEVLGKSISKISHH